ncbi:MAG TPA: dephospho-CoA kinase [Vicinamibacterales bacterium]|nr:dephospho-CoA kinase [Vicinamibacterales bacterium]
MSPRLLRVALTGGIATGKSYCLTRFAELGVPTVDADVLAHRAIAPGTTGFDAVITRFGRDVLHPHGEIDRARLGQIVFADERSRQDLEAIIHPAVYQAISDWLAAIEAAGHSRLAIADIPLLYETGRHTDFHRVIVAACPAAVQMTRLMARNRLTEEEARLRLASQMPIEEKMRRADYVIDTSGTKADTDTRVRDVWNAMSATIDGR